MLNWSYAHALAMHISACNPAEIFRIVDNGGLYVVMLVSTLAGQEEGDYYFNGKLEKFK